MASVRKPRTVVIPAAGLGTHWLPQTWVTPKELLPIVDRPLLHWVVQGALTAGLTRVVLVIAPGKEAVARYFNRPADLEAHLRSQGRSELLDSLLDLQARIEVLTAVQERPLGLGHAVLQARKLVGDEPFGVLLPDELFEDEHPLVALVKNMPDEQTAMLAVREVLLEDTSKYGIVAGKDEGGLFRVERAVEKPRPADAPSRLAIVGRYILPADTFEILESLKPGANGEVQLTDALSRLAEQGRVAAVRTETLRFDTGRPEGWLAANLHFARKMGRLPPAS